jgi:hypothetical protein
MPVNYKILFEVKLLHEFYLTRQDGTTIFDLPNQDQRINFLLEEFSRGNESINSDLSYEFHESTKKEYEGHGLKLLPAYSGFKVAARVNAKTLNDNSLVFEPYFPLPGNSCINVLIKKKDRSIDGYTNGAVNVSLPSFYFFSTEGITGDKIFPYLTHPISGFDAARKYEQGELASFGVNDVRAFYHDTAGDQWDSISAGSFANENDRLLLRPRFNYFFPASSSITNAEFILKDSDGNTVQSAVFSNTDRISKVTVDFSSIRDLLNMPGTSQFQNKVFSLEVSGNNGYSHSQRLLFSDRFYNESTWALVSVRSKPGNSDFQLIADDGYLIKRKNPLGIWVNAPVFEIPVKSRFNYWRFINNRGRKLELAPELQDYLDLEEGILLTKRPRSSTRYFFLLRKAGSSDTKYVPNPENYSLVKDNKERICFDVIVPESTLFHPVP